MHKFVTLHSMHCEISGHGQNVTDRHTKGVIILHSKFNTCTLGRHRSTSEIFVHLFLADVHSRFYWKSCFGALVV